jgi:hypothetical protein
VRAKVLLYLAAMQGASANPGINGGIGGSDPINSGTYEANLMLSWATKFFIDDINLKSHFFRPALFDFRRWIPASGPYQQGRDLFSSGTLGLMAWGGAVSRVSNFRLRSTPPSNLPRRLDRNRRIRRLLRQRQ